MFLGQFYKHHKYLILICTSCYFFIWLKFSGTIDPIKPDSIGYLNFFDGAGSHRISGYPIFLLMLKKFNFSIAQITYLQLGIFAFAINYFMNLLVKLRINKLIIFILFIGIAVNPYLNQYHFMLLTESLSFSLLICFICSLISLHQEIKLKKIFSMGLICGFLVSLKPISIIFTIIGLFFLFLFLPKWQNFFQKMIIHSLIFCLPIIFILSIENYVFHSEYDQRKSQLTQHLYGKAIMMTTFAGYKVVDDKSPESRMLLLLDNEYSEDQKYIESLQSTSEKIAIYTLLENDAYKHPALEERIKLIAENENLEIENLKKSIFFKGLKNNPMVFVKMTLRHYFAFFNIKPSSTYYNAFGGPKHLTNNSIKFSSSTSQKVIHSSFLIFGFFFYLFSVYLIFEIFRSALTENLSNLLKKDNLFFISVVFLIITHSIHLSHALLGVFVPRYLMLSYPYILFFELIMMEKAINYKKI